LITRLKKLKLISKLDGSAIAIALEVVPCSTNREYIKRIIVFYIDDFTMVTEREAEWLLNIQKEYKFAEVFED